MSGFAGIMAAGAGGVASPVVLTDQYVMAHASDNAYISCAVTFKRDGSIRFDIHANGNTTSTYGNWYAPTQSGASAVGGRYWIKAVEGGSYAGPGNTLISLDTEPVWYLTRFPSEIGTSSTILVFYIYADDVGGKLLATSNSMTLTAIMNT